MDVKLINPFLNATVQVLDTMAHVSAKPEKPYLRDDNTAAGVVTGLLILSGAAEGTLSVSFDEPSILNIVSNMFGEDKTTVDEEIEHAVVELSMMISNQACKDLEKMEIILNAETPKIIAGENQSINHYNKEPRIALPFTTESGSFTVEVCLESRKTEAGA
jgi:chemotaxis protein CheX